RKPQSRPSQVRRFRSDPERAQIQRRRLTGEGTMLSTDLACLKAYMAENPGAVIEDVARERKVTPRAVLEALPDTMVRIGAGSEFGAAMNDVAQWGEVTLIVHTEMAVKPLRLHQVEIAASDLARRDRARELEDRIIGVDDQRHLAPLRDVVHGSAKFAASAEAHHCVR